MDWTTTVFLFPGQGSQEVGMGKDIAATYEIARETYAEADDILGVKLSEVMFEGPEDVLNDTMNTQPAMYIHSIALLRVLQQALPNAQPRFVAGHSLGELTALTAAGSLSFAEGAALVRERGRLMHRAGELESGAMAAIIGAEDDEVMQLCQMASEKTGKPLVPANYNNPGQIVISGDSDAVDVAIENAKDFGARRAIRLAVSVAPHSPLMQPAERDFAKLVEQTTFNTPQMPVYANISAQPLTLSQEIRSEIESQLTNPVRWTKLVQAMIADGAETFIEIGSKNVLTGLMRRIDRSKNARTINSLESLQTFIAENS